MKIVLAWMFAAIAVYFMFRAIALDNRLWGKRRGGAPRWMIWTPPARWWNLGQDTAEGDHTRRASHRAIGLAILFGVLALLLSQI
jgi:hypothetical protein